MSEQVFSHKPVLLDECIETLAIRRRACIWTALWAGRGTTGRLSGG